MYKRLSHISKTILKGTFLGFKWCRQNEFVFQFTCLGPHLYIKIHAPRLTALEALESDDEQHFHWRGS